VNKQNESPSEPLLLTRRDQKTLAVLLVLLSLSLVPALLNRTAPADTDRHNEYVFLLDINTAPAAELQLLPGIGEKLSQSIISYRQENGQFQQHSELQNVKGIGIKRLTAMRPFLADIPQSHEITSNPEVRR